MIVSYLWVLNLEAVDAFRAGRSERERVRDHRSVPVTASDLT